MKWTPGFKASFKNSQFQQLTSNDIIGGNGRIKIATYIPNNNNKQSSKQLQQKEEKIWLKKTFGNL